MTSTGVSSAHIRYPRMALLGAGLLAVCLTPMVRSAWLFALYLIPLLAVAYILRTGTDADTNGLVLRTLLRRTRLGWGQVRGLWIGKRGELFALLDDARVRLPAAREAHLPALQAVSEAAVLTAAPAVETDAAEPGSDQPGSDQPGSDQPGVAEAAADAPIREPVE